MLPIVAYVVGAVGIAIWIFLLHILKKADLKFWRYAIGAAGFFIIAMVFLMPFLTNLLAQIVALIASIPGKVSGAYSAYYRYGTIMIASVSGTITLKIDFECSGVIEILAFLALLIFYQVYTVWERVWVGILGVIYIIVCNALRITIICFIISAGGVGMFHIAHTYVGRIVFYGLSILLYFYVFTRPQIIKQKVGSFKYDADK